MVSDDIMVSGILHKGVNRVLRGGNWMNHPQYLRSADRNGNHPGNRNSNIGLRLAGAFLAEGQQTSTDARSSKQVYDLPGDKNKTGDGLVDDCMKSPLRSYFFPLEYRA